ncbi:MAG TPA: GNAT family N-acetyltransferase [Thermoplasmata archaeon]|nr:GNAT family N-acetyltransferase [Thermoplasmata archaeon]
MPGDLALNLRDLAPDERAAAVPILIDSFVGIYRWHAKRTLREIERVRGADAGGQLLGISMLERLVPEVGYVYYIAVASAARRQGVGARLLDDALSLFRGAGVRIVYAAAEEDNRASLSLFRSRGFRPVDRDEPGWREGGLGAWGLRSRMRVVHGEVLLGRRFAPEPVAPPPTGPGAPGR